MFQVNEYVVYGRTGVCLIEGVEQNYYCLRSIHQNCYIKAPIDGKIPIRRVITRDEANALIDIIPSIRVKPMNGSNARELDAKYRALASSQNCQELITLTMSIYARKQELRKNKKKITASDEAYMKEGEGRLFGELSIALGIPYDEVQSYIQNRVKKSAVPSCVQS